MRLDKLHASGQSFLYMFLYLWAFSAHEHIVSRLILFRLQALDCSTLPRLATSAFRWNSNTHHRPLKHQRTRGSEGCDHLLICSLLREPNAIGKITEQFLNSISNSTKIIGVTSSNRLCAYLLVGIATNLQESTYFLSDALFALPEDNLV